MLLHPSIHGCGPLWEGEWPWATLPTVFLPWTQPLKGLTAESNLLTALPSRSWGRNPFPVGDLAAHHRVHHTYSGKPNTCPLNTLSGKSPVIFHFQMVELDKHVGRFPAVPNVSIRRVMKAKETPEVQKTGGRMEMLRQTSTKERGFELPRRRRRAEVAKQRKLNRSCIVFRLEARPWGSLALRPAQITLLLCASVSSWVKWG